MPQDICDWMDPANAPERQLTWKRPMRDRYDSVLRESACGRYVIKTWEFDLPIRCKGYEPLVRRRNDGSLKRIVGNSATQGILDDLQQAKEACQAHAAKGES